MVSIRHEVEKKKGNESGFGKPTMWDERKVRNEHCRVLCSVMGLFDSESARNPAACTTQCVLALSKMLKGRKKAPLPECEQLKPVKTSAY